MTLSVVWSLPPFGGGTVMYCSKSAWPPIGFCSWRFPWHRVDRLPLALVRRRHACAYVHLKRAFVAAAVTTGEAPMRVGNSPLARDRGCVRL
ncbi:hypothetical protein V6N11_046057 [Hibiscus sabdariffa]|uniref:Secreted protein n=1 Tax=Hibiscus sabdariffa TaxID=183260 RepID=A0ABR1Z9F5_9ROSI